MPIANVLYVDKNVYAKATVRRFFVGRSGYSLDTAEDMFSALALLNKNNYRIMIVNYTGPETFGFAVSYKSNTTTSVVLSDDISVRNNSAKRGLPNSPKSPISGRLDLIVKAYEGDNLRKLGLK